MTQENTATIASAILNNEDAAVSTIFELALAMLTIVHLSHRETVIKKFFEENGNPFRQTATSSWLDTSDCKNGYDNWSSVYMSTFGNDHIASTL